MINNTSRRGKLLLLNSITSLASQAVTVICGFVLTRLILQSFGSEINGLTASITQFLGFIAFLEMGIGAVVKSALYQPLADNNTHNISLIVTSCKRFYRKIAGILVIYAIVLTIVFPLITKNFSWIFTASLVVIISISLFAQYFFGMPYQLLMNADQRSYVPSIVCSVTIILNTIVSAIAIALGASIQIVKLIASIIYIFRPIIYILYVEKNYSLEKKIQLTEEPLKQKWNGLAQHIAYVVVNYTDIVVLTFLSTFASVSIYTVYHNVTIGVQQIISSLTVGVSAMIGNVLYSESIEKTRETFGMVEWFFHTLTVLMFSLTGVLIIPFVKIYTSGVSDANYIVPAFAILITVAQASYSLRTPYETMVLAANHFKQTQNSAIIETLMNIIISVCLVKYLGLIGVAIGTIIAMVYRTVYFVLYLSHNILNYKISSFFKLLGLDLVQVFLCVSICHYISTIIAIDNWLDWIILALIDCIICLVVCSIINYLFNRNYLNSIIRRSLK